MQNRHITYTCETEQDPTVLFDLLAEPENLPVWAPEFADSLRHDHSNHYTAVKNGRDFALRIVENRLSLTVDYLREVAPGSENGAYLRLIPRNGGGSVILMTVPLAALADTDNVRNTLKDELHALVALARGGGDVSIT